MFSFTRTSTALAFVALLPLSTLAAQSPLALSTQQSARADAARQPDPAALDVRIAIAAQYRADGRLPQSLREYREIARVQREIYLNAAETFWSIAEIHMALDEPMEAARALDSAAFEAVKHGDPDFQLRALFESAAAYVAAGRYDIANDRAEAIEPLLDDPDVTAELRAEMRARLRGTAAP